MCTPRSPLLANLHHQLGVGQRDQGIVIQDGNHAHDVVEELLSISTIPSFGKFDTNSKFRDSNRCNGDVIIVVDNRVEGALRAFGVSQKKSYQAAVASESILRHDEIADLFESYCPFGIDRVTL